jgi:hypothetical protein
MLLTYKVGQGWLVSRDMARMSFLDYIDIVDDRVSAARAGLDSSGCVQVDACNSCQDVSGLEVDLSQPRDDA